MKFKVAKMYVRQAKAVPAYRFSIFDEGGENGGTDGNGGDKGAENGGDGGEDKDDDKDKPKYTDADLDKIINQKFSQWQKRQEKAVDEAKKLEKMSADEQNAKKLSELQKRLDEMEKKDAESKMAASARKLLQGEGIVVDDVIVSALIREDAEHTKAAVDAFVKSFKTAVQNAAKMTFGRKEKPKTGGNGGTGAMTREEILQIKDRAKRQKAIEENMNLFR